MAVEPSACRGRFDDFPKVATLEIKPRPVCSECHSVHDPWANSAINCSRWKRAGLSLGEQNTGGLKG